MRSLAHCLVLVLVLVLGSCAAQIPAAQQVAYFNCPGIVVDAASENLQRAGYITAWREGEASIETQWARRSVATDDQVRLMFLRYVVQTAGDGVEFQIYERSEDAKSEAPWQRITQSGVEDPGMRELLEKIRRDVCGRDEPFFQTTGTSSSAL